MKPILAATLSLIVILTGCAKTAPIKADQSVAESLGANVVYVLSRPTRIEGWNFQRADGTVSADPALVAVNLSVARELAMTILDDASYTIPARGGSFDRAVGFKVWRDDQTIDIYFSFTNDQMWIKSTGYTGQGTNTLSGVAAAHDKLVKVAQGAFPQYKPPMVAK